MCFLVLLLDLYNKYLICFAQADLSGVFSEAAAAFFLSIISHGSYDKEKSNVIAAIHTSTFYQAKTRNNYSTDMSKNQYVYFSLTEEEKIIFYLIEIR